MRRTGSTYLPLHPGKAPGWLVSRMKGLAREIVALMVDEYGPTRVVRALADPFWFQALACVLAYDWHSSGTTTVTCGILKSVISPELHGLAVVGGKGRHSTAAPREIRALDAQLSLSSRDLETLEYSSRMAAKVDNAGLQDGYSLYHHAMFIAETGAWAVVQQGLNARTKYARRYQWLADPALNFVQDPHAHVRGPASPRPVTNLVTAASAPNQATSTDLVKDSIASLRREVQLVLKGPRATLDWWTSPELRAARHDFPEVLLPARVNWDAINLAHETQPAHFEELLALKGMGPATLRGLALVSELVHDAPFSRRDPVKYSFAYGGKDGVPYPVNRRSMDESIQFLRAAVDECRVGNREKKRAFKRLARLSAGWHVEAPASHHSMSVRARTGL